MTFEEFSDGLIRLIEAHGGTLTSGKIAAYFQKLQHCDVRDWDEAVINLQAADRAPKDWEVMLKEIDRCQTIRRRQAVCAADRQAIYLWNHGPNETGDRFGDLLQQCCFHRIRYIGAERPKAEAFLREALENVEFVMWARQQRTNHPDRNTLEFIQDCLEGKPLHGYSNPLPLPR